MINKENIVINQKVKLIENLKKIWVFLLTEIITIVFRRAATDQ